MSMRIDIIASRIVNAGARIPPLSEWTTASVKTAGMLEIMVPALNVGERDQSLLKGNDDAIVKKLTQKMDLDQFSPWIYEVWDGNKLVGSGSAAACLDAIEEYRA